MNNVSVQSDAVVRAMRGLDFRELDKRKDLRKIVRYCISQARKNASKDIRSAVTNDPRGAYRALRMTIYKRMFGGNINILSPRKGTAQVREYHKPTKFAKGERHVGGNRIARSERTKMLDGYYGKARGFVLRFLNNGTASRNNGHGNRGSITAMNIFTDGAQTHMEKAAGEIERLISEAMEQVWESR